MGLDDAVVASWHLDPVTLRETVDDRAALEYERGVAAPVDRSWLLRVLGRSRAAVVEGQLLLTTAEDPWRLLLLVAHAHHWLGEWVEAARLQDDALRRAVNTPREATTRQHIGKRLLDEGRGAEAVVQLVLALQLREAAGVDADLVRSSRAALLRARVANGAR